MNRVRSGIDHIASADGLLRDKRVGLMTNPTGIDHNLRSTIDIVAERYRLSALFAVEIKKSSQKSSRLMLRKA